MFLSIINYGSSKSYDYIWISMLKYVLAFFALFMVSIAQVCAVDSWKCLGISGCKKDKTGRGYSLQALSGKQTNDKLTSETSSIH